MPGYTVILTPKPNHTPDTRQRTVAVWADDEADARAIIALAEPGWQVHSLREDS